MGLAILSQPICCGDRRIGLGTSSSFLSKMEGSGTIQTISACNPFDASNLGRNFWSIDQTRDETGKPIGTYWEYRALVSNDSAKALKNVKVAIEAVGPMPQRPGPSYFDIETRTWT